MDLSTLLDAAYTFLALIAVIASVTTAWIVHKYTGPVVSVRVVYYGWLKPRKAPGPHDSVHRHATTALGSAGALHAKFDEEYFVTPFLRAVVTNRGRLDVSVDSIAYENKEEVSRATKQKGDPDYPVPLKAQSYIYYQQLYTELQSSAGRYSRIRFAVTLTNGDMVYSRWIKLYDKPAKR